MARDDAAAGDISRRTFLDCSARVFLLTGAGSVIPWGAGGAQDLEHLDPEEAELLAAYGRFAAEERERERASEQEEDQRIHSLARPVCEKVQSYLQARGISAEERQGQIREILAREGDPADLQRLLDERLRPANGIVLEAAREAGIDPLAYRRELAGILGLRGVQLEELPSFGISLSPPTPPPDPKVVGPGASHRTNLAPPYPRHNLQGSPRHADRRTGQAELRAAVDVTGKKGQIAEFGAVVRVNQGATMLQPEASISCEYYISSYATFGQGSSQAILNLSLFDGRRVVKRDRRVLATSTSTVLWIDQKKGQSSPLLSCQWRSPEARPHLLLAGFEVLVKGTAGGGYASMRGTVQSMALTEVH